MDEILNLFEIRNNCLVSETSGLTEEEFYVLCPYGIGDTLYVAMFMKEYCRMNHISRPVCFLVKEKHSVIPGWFSDITSVIASDVLVDVLNYWTISNGFWRGNNYLYGHFPKTLQNVLDPVYGQAAEKNMVCRYRTITMQLPGSAGLTKPDIPILNAEAVKEVYGVDRQTVIFMPYAVSCAMVPEIFWVYLAEMLSKLGYRIYTNVKDESEKPIEGTQPISEDLEKMASIGAAAGAVIAIRSGICDILAQTDARMVVLNTSRELYEEWDLCFAVEREGIRGLLFDSDARMAQAAAEVLRFIGIPI